MGSLPEREYTKAELERMHKQMCIGCVSCLRTERDALQARVEGLDTDLTEIATTMTEHFDSVDLNDLPVSLTKGIKALVALAKRRKRAMELILKSVPPNPEFTAEDGVRVYELQLDELDIALARAAIEEKKHG